MIVEIIGLAGTGKSTLARALCRRYDSVQPGRSIQIKNPRHLPYVLWHSVASLPPFLLQSRRDRWLTKREVVKLLSLNGWNRMLRRQATHHDAVIVMDQGPVYDLATLHGFGPDWLRRHANQPWWQRTFDRWGATLDLVIWLARIIREETDFGSNTNAPAVVQSCDDRLFRPRRRWR